VEAVGQLDQEHPDVPGHRDDQLAVVLRLLLLLALEVDPRQLCDPVDELRDLGAELAPDLVHADARVLHGVVEEGRHDRHAVEPEASADAGGSPGGA